MREGGERLFLFVRWNVSGDEEDAGEGKLFARGLRQGDVAAVDGIESAAEEAEFHGVGCRASR